VLEPEPYIFSIGASALIVGTLAHPTATFSGAAATFRADAPRPVLIPAPGARDLCHRSGHRPSR
jgi:hypothetical protein